MQNENLYTPFVSEREWRKEYPEVDREYVWTYPLIYKPQEFTPSQVFELSPIPECSKEMVIYVHQPACLFRCPMCPFYVEVISSKEEISGYADKVIQEFMFYYRSGLLRSYSLKAIYFGGGTASLFSPEDIRKIIRTITSILQVSEEHIEITVEGHPSTVNYNYLSALLEYGVNRVSFGIQSFDDNVLQKLGLKQTAMQNKRVLENAMRLGFQTVSADMLYRVPGQDVSNCVEQLKQFLDMGIQSLSAYSLELSVREGNLIKEQPSEETDRQMFYAINQVLMDEGWFHTAQPDYSKPQNVSKETVVTWKAPQGQTLGLGAGACSSINSTVYFNVHNLEEYNRVIEQQCLPILTGQKFTIDDAMSRFMVLGTRSFILPRQIYKNIFGVDMIDSFKESLAYLTERELVKINDEFVEVTQHGKYYVDNISKTFYSKNNKCHLQPWGEKISGAVAEKYLRAKDIEEK